MARVRSAASAQVRTAASARARSAASAQVRTATSARASSAASARVRSVAYSRTRRATSVLVACLTAACVLAACSGGGAAAGSAKGRPGLARPLPGRFGRRFVVIGGGGGPAGLIAIGGLGGGKSGRPQISVPPIPPASSGRLIAMPLDSYEQVAGNEQEVLVEASSLLTQRCMTARGFSYPEAAQPSTELSALQQTENSPVGLTKLGQAQIYGYAKPKSGTGSSGPVFFGLVGGQVFGQAIQDHGAAWVTALLGFSPGPVQQNQGRHEGCVPLVTSELYGPDGGSANPDPVPGIAFQALQWTQSDPRIVAVNKAWSRCMTARGYGYGTPQEAAQKNWPSAPSTVEIATAVADVTCKAQTDLTNTWLTVEAAYQLALIDQNLTALSQLQSNFKGLLQRAEALVGAGSLPAGP
jgi:hypothetical protein